MGGIRIAHFIRLLDGGYQWMKRFGILINMDSDSHVKPDIQ